LYIIQFIYIYTIAKNHLVTLATRKLHEKLDILKKYIN